MCDEKGHCSCDPCRDRERIARILDRRGQQIRQLAGLLRQAKALIAARQVDADCTDGSCRCAGCVDPASVGRRICLSKQRKMLDLDDVISAEREAVYGQKSLGRPADPDRLAALRRESITLSQQLRERCPVCVATPPGEPCEVCEEALGQGTGPV
jgi:hypothetical protein